MKKRKTTRSTQSVKVPVSEDKPKCQDTGPCFGGFDFGLLLRTSGYCQKTHTRVTLSGERQMLQFGMAWFPFLYCTLAKQIALEQKFLLVQPEVAKPMLFLVSRLALLSWSSHKQLIRIRGSLVLKSMEFETRPGVLQEQRQPPPFRGELAWKRFQSSPPE